MYIYIYTYILYMYCIYVIRDPTKEANPEFGFPLRPLDDAFSLFLAAG